MLDMKFTPCGSRVCIIKFFSYEDKNPCGILQNPNLEGETRFGSLTQLLFAMDNLFDDIGNPRRTMTPRGFVRELPQTGDAGEFASARPIATFRVDVMFRQNASWQGNLVWVEKKQESQFRSVLELLMILDGALREEETVAVS